MSFLEKILDEPPSGSGVSDLIDLSNQQIEQQARHSQKSCRTPELSLKLLANLVLCTTTVLGAHGAPEVHAGTNAGAIEGTVRFVGEEIPAPTTVLNTTDPHRCDPEQSLEDLLISAETRGLKNVIVSLDSVELDSEAQLKTKSPPERLVIDNRSCRFEPHAAVVVTGTVIEASNSDSFLHTTHLYGPIEANLALPVRGSRVQRTVSKKGLIVVKCDVHGWMQAYIRVDDHPFHAVTGEQGQFRIDGIPPGRYTLEIWHERLGHQRTLVEVESGGVTSLNLSL